ncbi:hypothetical protein Micbo1qcDRAFT_237581 [Microdochium bolleyi]|uniref:Chromo domain-containing protein n=1 Tax=Microdochium bolleyi TaxID=196109 RepID=A0A136IJH5_9PEZI|nr:hypothetical protein Micbo1qcDRAFT_237581 [Microdochium bolleyi]
MAGFVKGLGDTINAVFTPKKQTPEVPSAAAAAATPAQMNATLDTDTRKRKPDVYDDIPGAESSIQTPHGDDAAQTTPDTNEARTINSDMYAPGTVAHSANKIKRRGTRLSSASQADGAKAVDPRVDAVVNLERARMPDAARLQPDNHDPSSSVIAAVPEADMRGDAADLFSTSIKSKAEIAGSSPTEPQPTQEETQSETSTAPGEAKAEGVREEEDGDVAEVHALLDHKMLEDKSVDLLVHWQGESPESATWEPETEVQEGASELLFSYWEKAGGRDRVLFKIESGVYHVFRILNHEKKPQGSFMLEVQWVGYSATKGNTSWETEVKLKKIAPELLDAYWESIGGRNDFLSKRGRTKKNA